MVELRWRLLPDGNKILEYRVKVQHQHFSLTGEYSLIMEWSEWKFIPTVKTDEHIFS